MRPLEWLLAAVVALAVWWPVVFGARWKRGRMAVLLLAAFVVQATLEGWRWQLIPLYLTALGLAVGDIVQFERNLQLPQRLGRGVLGTLGVAALLVLPVALPVPQLPPPSGPYAVGTTSFLLVDPEREEPWGTTAGRPRRVMVQAWYPTPGVEDPEYQTWTPDFEVVAPALSRRIGLPPFFLSHTRYTTNHSIPQAPGFPGRLPVVVYSHGWTGFRHIAVNQMEALASHGFLVVAPDHTHAAIATRFPDGRVAPLDPEALPEEETVGETAYAEAATLLVETFSDDLLLVLDSLAEGGNGEQGRVAEMADLSAVGIYGHSTGGGAAVRTCLLDERCKAVLGLDAWVEFIPNLVLARDLGVPSLFIRSDPWRGTPNDLLLRGLAERSRSLSYWMALEGAHHNDFVLTPLFSPVAATLGLKGPIPSERVVPILDQYLVGFFVRTLTGLGGSVLDDPPPPEVRLEVVP